MYYNSDNYMRIFKNNIYGGITIKAYYRGQYFKSPCYIGYTEKQAIQKFRHDNNLIGKHMPLI